MEEQWHGVFRSADIDVKGSSIRCARNDLEIHPSSIVSAGTGPESPGSRVSCRDAVSGHPIRSGAVVEAKEHHDKHGRDHHQKAEGHHRTRRDDSEEVKTGCSEGWEGHPREAEPTRNARPQEGQRLLSVAKSNSRAGYQTAYQSVHPARGLGDVDTRSALVSAATSTVNCRWHGSGQRTRRARDPNRAASREAHIKLMADLKTAALTATAPH
jgi:hypothetical protein